MQHHFKDQQAAKHLRLPRRAYLRRRVEFEEVRQQGVTVHGRLMLATVLVRNPQLLPKFGLITSRKVGPAVTRNRVRRRLREIIRLHQRELPMGIWLVIVAKRAAAKAGYLELEQEWIRLVKKALARK